MNGRYHNTRVRSQAGIHQEKNLSSKLLAQLYNGLNVNKDELECKRIVFSENFFLFGSLIFISTILGIFVILFFWGPVFFVRERQPSGSQSRSRENTIDEIVR